MTALFQFKIGRGAMKGIQAVNKFGRATNADSGVATDVWDGANATDDVDIWVAPTQARVHNVVSTSTSDIAGGAGARTLRVSGLTDWDTREVSEDITMDGTDAVATQNAYVIVHRLQVLTKGATSANVGVITATAVSDGTVTAQIGVGNGQTQMAIYGVSSLQSAYVTLMYSDMIKTGQATSSEADLLVNPEPDVQVSTFLTKHTFGLVTTGTSHHVHQFNPWLVFPGPAIIKVQVNTSANDTDVSGGFDLYLVDK